MSKKDEALKLALKKAFDLGKRYWQQANSDFTSQWRKSDVTLASFNQLVEDTIRDALAEQPAQQQEPVAWMYVNKDGECEQIEFGEAFDDPSVTLLYTAPPKREWIWLTEEEIVVCGGMDGADNWVFEFANALQIKLREKNHG